MSELGVARDRRLGIDVQGRYRILRKLGEGGMGAVYEGEHLLIRRRVAIKTLHPHMSQNPEIVARFRREALAATATRNEHVVEVTDMGQFDDDGALYIVLEYLDGRNLAQEVEASGPMPLGRAVRIMSQICEALEVLHAQGIIHRDLKPENLFLVKRSDNPDFVKILDFGISKFKSPLDGGPTHLTDEGMMLGTAHFMSPEQAAGDKDVDHRTDIYALGGILYHMLTGAFPFEAETLPMLFVKLATEAPPALSLRRTDLPQAVEEAVDRCLAKNKEERFATVAELRRALAPYREVADRPSLKVPAEPMPVLTTTAAGRASLKTRPLWPWAIAVLGVAAVAVLALRPNLPAPTVQQGASTPATTPLPTLPSAREVKVRIWAQPATAELVLDGQPIPNPFDDSRPAASGEHLIEARAEGFESDSKRAVFDQDTNLRLVLQKREDAASRPRAAAPVRARSTEASETGAMLVPPPSPPSAQAAPPPTSPPATATPKDEPPTDGILGKRTLKRVSF